jgi:hypothetical protein
MAQVRRVGGNRLIGIAGEGLKIAGPARVKPTEQPLLCGRWIWINTFDEYATVDAGV